MKTGETLLKTPALQTLQGVTATLVEDYGQAAVSKPLDIRGKNSKASLLNREL